MVPKKTVFVPPGFQLRLLIGFFANFALQLQIAALPPSCVSTLVCFSDPAPDFIPGARFVHQLARFLDCLETHVVDLCVVADLGVSISFVKSLDALDLLHILEEGRE